MSKLKEILSIQDKESRQLELRRYAHALGIQDYQAYDTDGELIEEKLILLIHDARDRNTVNKNQEIYMIAVGVFFLIVFLLAIFYLPGFLKWIYYD